jgi:hypothetical protein
MSGFDPRKKKVFLIDGEIVEILTPPSPIKLLSHLPLKKSAE